MFYRNFKFFVIGATVFVWIRLMLGTIQYLTPSIEQLWNDSHAETYTPSQTI